MKKYIKANHDFDYDIGGNDPADWYIDYDGFFEAIEYAIEALSLEIEDFNDEETIGGRICTYTLSNGSDLDSYDLETEILHALADGDILGSETDIFIQEYIKDNCM